MRKLRSCTAAQLHTGVSKCPLDIGKMVGAIVVNQGSKLPADLTAEKIEEAVHADGNSRIYGIVKFVEAAKNGGEAQTYTAGYGPEEFNGFSARKDTFTLDKFYPELHASITKCANVARGVYFFDENNVLYGIDDGTDTLAPFDISCMYSDATPFATSSAKATMTVTFSYVDARQIIEDYNFVTLDFNPAKLTLGLTPVVLKKVGTTGSKFKLYEKFGGYDVTSIYGPLIVEGGAAVLNGATTAATYADDELTITATGGATPSLKSPATLYTKDIKGIEQVAG